MLLEDGGHAINDIELIEASLERAAETAGDITPLVYARFFSLYPETEEHFVLDEGDVVKGRMLAGILTMVMDHAAGRVYEHKIAGLVTDHLAYQATLPMFATMFDCLRDVVREAMGNDWNGDFQRAWDVQSSALLGHVGKTHPQG